MPELFALRCPTCGGGLQVEGDQPRFVCPHCANRYLLDRRVDELGEAERENLRASVTYTTAVGQWLRVADYAVHVHTIAQETVKPDRVLYVDIELQNPSGAPLTCRHDQWIAFDADGYTYEAAKDFTHPRLYEQKGRRYLGMTRIITPGMRLRGWLAFVIPAGSQVHVLQFSGGAPLRSAEFQGFGQPAGS